MKVGFTLLLAVTCSPAFAQSMVPIDWPGRKAGETVVSVTENQVRLTESDMRAQGYMQAPEGYWFKPVMSTGECSAPGMTFAKPDS